MKIFIGKQFNGSRFAVAFAEIAAVVFRQDGNADLLLTNVDDSVIVIDSPSAERLISMWQEQE